MQQELTHYWAAFLQAEAAAADAMMDPAVAPAAEESASDEDQGGDAAWETDSSDAESSEEED